MNSNKTRTLWLARLLLGLLLIAVLLVRGKASSVIDALRLVSPSTLIIGIAAYLFGQFLCAWKWMLLLRTQGNNISLRDCCKLYWLGMFWNLWMPTNIGGDAVRAYRAGSGGSGRTAAASSVLVDRLTGLAALLSFGCVGLLYSGLGRPRQNLAALGVIVAVAALCGLAMLIVGLVHRSSHNAIATIQPPSLPARLASALVGYLDHRHRQSLAWALTLSLLFQASQIALNSYFAGAIGLHIDSRVFLWLVPILALASLLPVGIGGLGVREVAAVTLLKGAGLSLGGSISTILAWSLLWQATVWLSSLPGALWAFQTDRDPRIDVYN